MKVVSRIKVKKNNEITHYSLFGQCGHVLFQTVAKLRILQIVTVVQYLMRGI